MLWTKACPRCRGDLFLDRDMYGYYKHCLQCGYLLDITETEAQQPAEALSLSTSLPG